MFYSYKPSGRGYGYVENDGTPLYPFGYGLSYTTFELSDIDCINNDRSLTIKLIVKNTGNFDGAEVIQIYLSGRNCDVVMPIKELKAYKRIELCKGERAQLFIDVPEEAFLYYDRKLRFSMHDGDYSVLIGTSSVDIVKTFDIKVRDERIC